MKNINTMLKSIKTTLKTSKIVKLLSQYFNKFAKFAHIKPKQLMTLLGLLLVCILTLGLGMNKGYKEGQTSYFNEEGVTTEYNNMTDIDNDRIKAVDAMNCAINNSTTVQLKRDTMRNKINVWYDNYVTYLQQCEDFNVKNNMDISGNDNGRIYKIKDDNDINGNTMPKYIDDEDTSSITDLTKYDMVYVYGDKGSADVDGDNKIYQIKDENDISGNTMPKYLDNDNTLPATTSDNTPSLQSYRLIDVRTAISKESLDIEENDIKSYFSSVTTSTSLLPNLLSKFAKLKQFATNSYAYIFTITNTSCTEGFTTDDVNLILNQGTENTVTGEKNVDPCDTSTTTTTTTTTPTTTTTTTTTGGDAVHCVGSWTEIDTCDNGIIKKKYTVTTSSSNGGSPCEYAHNEIRTFHCEETETETEPEIPESITNPQLLLDYINKIDTDFANADKWKQLYVAELKRRNEYIKYANSHNLKYHSNGTTTSQQRQQTQGTHQYDSLTGNGKVGVPPGDEDLYMLKSRMVPPTNPPGSGLQSANGNGNGNGNGKQELAHTNGCSKPAPVPPCPPCERCPEPAFDCKRVPNYNSITSNQYLPRPVLNDFSQFGM